MKQGYCYYPSCPYPCLNVPGIKEYIKEYRRNQRVLREYRQRAINGTSNSGLPDLFLETDIHENDSSPYQEFIISTLQEFSKQ